MGANILAIEEIVSDPKVRGGRPVIRGTGITVMNVVLAHTTGDKFPLERVADGYGLTLAQVHAAMAYYYLHQAELDERLQLEKQETERLLEELNRRGKASPIFVDPE
jgi:uncharacterized protein (DUF433 family)